MRRGRRIAVDPGVARIGIAQCDPDGILATPLRTLAAAADDLREQFLGVLAETEPIEILFGLPLSLKSRQTASTENALALAEQLSEWTDIPIRLVDERLTTVSAQHTLSSLGKSAKKSRTIIDQVAAVIILQDALDYERRNSNPPGRLFSRAEEE